MKLSKDIMGSMISNTNKEKTCSICLEDFPPAKIAQIRCRHNFCLVCLGAWLKLNQTCPLCRSVLVENQKVINEIETSVTLVMDIHKSVFGSAIQALTEIFPDSAVNDLIQGTLGSILNLVFFSGALIATPVCMFYDLKKSLSPRLAIEDKIYCLSMAFLSPIAYSVAILMSSGAIAMVVTITPILGLGFGCYKIVSGFGWLTSWIK